MSDNLVAELAAAVRGSVLEPRLEPAASRLRTAADAAASPAALRGLARAIAARPETAGFLAHRPALLRRILGADSGELRRRAAELERWSPGEDDLEGSLDALRLLRREETCVAACAHLGGLVEFDEVSLFLSLLAETITQRALDLTRSSAPDPAFAVIGLGKIAGREFTYHSDLDLIFLAAGGPDVVHGASRVGQRLIAYLQTMTGAGVAYAVDTRLRPSGHQGMLVTTLEGFERHQCRRAQTWEHLALMRSRPIAGALAPAGETLERVWQHLRRAAQPPWPELVAIRRRVERERVASGAISFKTGTGGLMDVDFLAGGALLERPPEARPAIPSVPAQLRAVAAGPAVESLLADYALLRRVEAIARWVAGRGVETLPVAGEDLEVVAELFEPGLPGAALRDRIAAARTRIRSLYDRVTRGGGVEVLAG